MNGKERQKLTKGTNIHGDRMTAPQMDGERIRGPKSWRLEK